MEAAKQHTQEAPRTILVYEVQTRGFKNSLWHVSTQIPNYQLESGNPSLPIDDDGVQAPKNFTFTSNWKIDYKTVGDVEGWEYSTKWERLISPARSARGKAKSSDKVRRRRWTRKMIRLTEAEVRAAQVANNTNTVSKIQAGLFSVTKSIEQIQKFSSMIGTDKDSIQARDAIGKYIVLSSKLLSSTGDLVLLLEEESRRKKIGRELSQLEARLKKLCVEGERKVKLHPLRSISAEQEDDAKFLSPLRGITGASNFVKQYDTQQMGNYDNKSNRDSSDTPYTFEELQVQKKLVASSEVAVMERIVKEKGEAIVEVNESMQELAIVFKEVAKIVHEQQDLIDTVEANTEITNVRTKQGLSDLEKAVEIQRKATCVVS